MQQLPHVHIEVVPYADLADVSLSMPDRIKAIDNFKIFDDSGYSPTANAAGAARYQRPVLERGQAEVQPPHLLQRAVIKRADSAPGLERRRSAAK
jgi:hypothetical protein